MYVTSNYHTNYTIIELVSGCNQVTEDFSRTPFEICINTWTGLFMCSREIRARLPRVSASGACTQIHSCVRTLSQLAKTLTQEEIQR